MNLRERGIYILPNGRQLVAEGNTLLVADAAEITSYEINEHGRLLLNGKLTAWDVSNLEDSGATISNPSPAVP